MKEYRTRERIINEGATPSNDPRIDSPEIKVIYEPEEMPDQSEVVKEAIEPNGSELDQPIEQTTIPQEQKEHVCKVGVQKAIEQNWMYFSLIALALFGLGYALGKSKAS